MAHLPAEKLKELLKDIEGELNIIRSWEGIKEKSPYVFYYKSIPFMHFHFKDGERSADVKDSKKSWGRPILLTGKNTKVSRKEFLSEIERRLEGVKSK